jgi:hypothetical protein
VRTLRIAGGFTLAGAALAACSTYSSTGPTIPPETQLVQVSWCRGLAPAWVAFQDGDGPWTRATPTGTGANITYEYPFASNRGGIATMLPGGAGITSLSVTYGTPADLAAAGNTRTVFCGDPVAKVLLGIVVGLDADEGAVVSGGFLSQSLVRPDDGGRFALRALPSGPHDLVAARTTGADGQVTSFILRRDVDLPDSTIMTALDFTSAEAFAAATATLTLDGLGAEGARIGVRLLTGTTEVLLSPQPSSLSAAVARPYAGLPLAQLRPGDLQGLFASELTGPAIRFAQVYFRSIADRTLALPAALVRPTFATVATAPFLRPGAQFVAQADYDRAASVTYQQGITTLVSVTMTAAYAGLNLGGYDLVVPDLSGAAGFDPAWALHPGVPLTWTASRIGGTLGLGLGAQPTDGATQRFASDTDIIPAP